MINNPFSNWRPGLNGGASPEFYKNALSELYFLLAMIGIFSAILVAGCILALFFK